MKQLFVLILASALASASYAQEVKNTSYITSTGEKVLRLESVLPVGKKDAWAYFTTDEKLQKWAAPLVHMELKTGGYMVTNYDKSKSLSDASSIRLGIINYLEGEMITFKVKLNDVFPKQAQAEDQNLQEVVQFTEVDATHTRVISSMIGWGTGPHWDKTYDFFVKGNTWTYNEMLKLFK